MPHLKNKPLKLNLDKHSAAILAYAEGLVRRYAEKKIQEIIDLLRQQCPPPEVTNQIVQTTGTIRKMTSKAAKRAERVKKLSDILKVALEAIEIILNIISHFNIPVALGTPPGPQGGHIWAEAMGKLMTRQAKMQWYIDTRNKLEEENNNINDLLRNFDIVFVPILAKLELIDSVLNRCLENPNISAEDRFASIPENTDLKTGEDLSYTGLNGKPYIIKVITDPNSPSIAPQRRAIAVDSRGVTVLKGPLSFASDSQILIDELKFRIDNQLP